MIDKTILKEANDIVLSGLTTENAPEAVKCAYDKFWNIAISKYIKNPFESGYHIPLRHVGLFLDKNDLKKLIYLLEDQAVIYDGNPILKEKLFIRKEYLEEFIRVEYDKGGIPYQLTRKRK